MQIQMHICTVQQVRYCMVRYGMVRYLQWQGTGTEYSQPSHAVYGRAETEIIRVVNAHRHACSVIKM